MKTIKEKIKSNNLLTISLIILIIFSICIFSYTKNAMIIIDQTSLFVREYFGTFYLILGFICILFLIIIMISPFGKRSLGSSKPEFSFWNWISMLYSAGLGAGILIRAVQEPVFMQQNPPYASSLPNEILALEYTFFQWGLTPWAMYATFALIIGYYLHNKQYTILMSSAIKESVNKPIVNDSIDILTILTTIFGVVAMIAIGATQISGGLGHLFEQNFKVEIVLIIITVISVISTFSALMGVNKGIKFLSNLNILVTLFLLTFILVQNDIIQILILFIKSLYHYIIDFIPMSLALGKYNPGKEFLTNWTYYYWAFWLSWAPFTGIFIARISKGRSIRQFILAILIIPSLGTFFWFTTFGVSAFNLISKWGGYNNEFENIFDSLFIFFEAYPAQTLINSITIFLSTTFLITSIDSAIFVLSMFSDRGNQNPSKKHRLIWGMIIPIVSIALVLLGNVFPNIDVLNAMSKLIIITSLPFSFLTITMIITFFKKTIL